MLEPALGEQLAHEHWSAPCERCAASRDLVSVNGVSFDVLTVDTTSAVIHRFVDCGNSWPCIPPWSLARCPPIAAYSAVGIWWSPTGLRSL